LPVHDKCAVDTSGMLIFEVRTYLYVIVCYAALYVMIAGAEVVRHCGSFVQRHLEKGTPRITTFGRYLCSVIFGLHAGSASTEKLNKVILAEFLYIVLFTFRRDVWHLESLDASSVGNGMFVVSALLNQCSKRSANHRRQLCTANMFDMREGDGRSQMFVRRPKDPDKPACPETGTTG
jgi:hypothetical protein